MNICVLIDAWEPIWGGGQTHVWEISKILVNKYHHKIDIFTRKLKSENNLIYSDDEQYCHKQLNIFRIGPISKFFNPIVRAIWFINVIIEVYEKHKQEKYDLIHAHAYLSGIPGKILSKLLGIPVIFTVHGSNLLDLNKQNPLYYLEKFILTYIKYDAEITVSKSFLKYKNVNSNIIAIPNGVNIEEFAKVIKSKLKNKFVYLWIGRFDKVKGLPLLLEAFNKLLKHFKNIQLILVGNGPEISSIRLLVDKYQLNKFIKIIPKTDHRNIIKIYKQANVFILPSLSEGQPITILEAWAAKLPVIATNVGDNAELVENGVNGLLIRSNSVEKLYNAMLKIYQNAKLENMGNSGYKLVKNNYSWSDSVMKLNQLYKQITVK